MMTRTQLRHFKAWKNRALVAVVAAFVLFGFGLAWNSLRISNLQHQKNSAVSQKTSAQAQATAQESIANEGKALAQQVTDRCRTDRVFRLDNPSLCPQAQRLATATPPPILGPVGPPGPAPSDAQVQAAVNTYLALHPPPINYTVLRAFVNSYLAAHPAPAGPRGPSGSSVTGPPGPSGASGTGATGPPGPSGASGANGTNGSNGSNAPTVTSIDASVSGDTLQLVFHFSDGTSVTASTLLPAPRCPALLTVTPPNPIGPVQSENPDTPYVVCVPAPGPS
jgi:hypothetical protein